MSTKVGINGFGRIGRAITRILMERKGELDLVAINDLADAKSLAHLFKYDTVMGKWAGTIEVSADELVINGKAIKVLAQRNPAELPWKAMGVELVVESTGIFRTKESPKGGYGDHVKAGASKVVLTVPAKDDIDATIVLGVNNDMLGADTIYVSNASCTTNCLAPLAKVLADSFGIENGFMYNDSRLYQRPECCRYDSLGPSSCAGGGGEHYPDDHRCRQRLSDKVTPRTSTANLTAWLSEFLYRSAALLT